MYIKSYFSCCYVSEIIKKLDWVSNPSTVIHTQWYILRLSCVCSCLRKYISADTLIVTIITVREEGCKPSADYHWWRRSSRRSMFSDKLSRWLCENASGRACETQRGYSASAGTKEDYHQELCLWRVRMNVMTNTQYTGQLVIVER